MVRIGNWTAENCSTVGTGSLVLTSAIEAAARFKDSVSAGEVWYSIIDGANREAGIGTFNGLGVIERTTVTATLTQGVFKDNSPLPLPLSGEAIVACTFNALAYRRLVESIEINAAAIAANTLAIEQNSIDIATNVQGILANRADIDLNRIDIDLNRADINNILTGYMFDEKLGGYQDTGAHYYQNGDINNIARNSCYQIHSGDLINGPTELIGQAYLTTDVNVNGTHMIQTCVSSDAPAKAWHRSTGDSGTTWSDWELVVDGGAFPQRLAGYQDSGLSELFSGDLDTIFTNSMYYIQEPGTTNHPVDFETDGWVVTQSAGGNIHAQVLYGRGNNDEHKQWMRKYQAGAWANWKLIVDAEGILPSGGVIGDILVKQSSDKNDALWGNTLDSGYFI